MRNIDPVERHLFLEGIYLKYGYDFRQYADASLDRRLHHVQAMYEDRSLLDILKLCLESSAHFERIVPMLTIGTSEFFRDPKFFKVIRDQVLPVLKTYPTVNIWCAGCSTGEEPISMAILLKEEGLLNRATIFATDINANSLKRAKDGIFKSADMQMFARNYALSGGRQSPSDYYVSEYGLVRFDSELRDRIVYSIHNLATDWTFTEAHLILCRNVLIYFRKELQNRAFSLFLASLAYRGFLGIGSKETMRFSSAYPAFEPLDHGLNIFQLKQNAKFQPVLAGVE